MKRIILITGGARSGKSTYAENLALSTACLILKKVDSKQRVNNVSITHGKTAPVL